MYSEIFDSFDKSFALADFAFEKASALYEMVEKNHELMYQEASVFVYAKDRSFEDLTALYEAADNDSAEKKEGLLSKLLGAVGAIFKSIGDAIGKFFNTIRGKKVPEEVEVPNHVAAMFEDLPGLENESGTLLSKLTNPKTIIAALGTIGAATAGLVVGQKFIKKNKEAKNAPNADKPTKVKGEVAAKMGKHVENIRENFSKMIDAITKHFGAKGEENTNGTDNKDSGIIKQALGVFRNIGGVLKEVATGIMNSILSALKLNGKGETAEGGSETQDEPTAKSETPAESGEETPSTEKK